MHAFAPRGTSVHKSFVRRIVFLSPVRKQRCRVVICAENALVQPGGGGEDPMIGLERTRSNT